MVAEKDRELFGTFAQIELFNIVLSFVINLLLILAVVQSSKNLGGYRYLLFTINDIYFPLVHALTLPVICSYRHAFVMFSHGILKSKWSVCLFAASHSQTMLIMAHLFIYRLVALRWPAQLRFYTAFKTFFLVLCSVLLQKNLWFWNCWLNYNSDQELEDYLRPYLEEEFPGEEAMHIGALYYASFKNSEIIQNDKGIRPSAIFATMGFNAIMSFWVAVIVVCSVMIVRSFNERKMMSERNEALQKQLFATLLAQMVVPILCVFLPYALIINAPIFAQISAFPNLVSVALTFFPVLDAFVTIFGVRDYRDLFLSFLYVLRSNRVSPAISASSRQKRKSSI